MVFNGEEEFGDVTLGEEIFKRANSFKYLRSNVTSDGTLDSEIKP